MTPKTTLSILVAFALLGCAHMRPIPSIETQSVEFLVDHAVNNGQVLPVDIIYITYVDELQTVTRIGPDKWFDSDIRQQWSNKHSVYISGGDEPKTIDLNEQLLERTKMLIIYADFDKVKDKKLQQVIIDYAGQKSETVLVQSKRLMPKNESFRYPELKDENPDKN